MGANRALVAAVEARDPYTRGHSDRVTAYALSIGHQLGMPEARLEILELAGLLHDVGKIGVPEAVLNKPARLQTTEFDVIHRHPVQGADIVRNIRHPLTADVTRAVLHHHERWDGQGYPQGLSGTDIPLEARILAVADTFDALTSDRPYRKGMTGEEADRILATLAGTQLDPEVAAAFREVRKTTAVLAGEAGRQSGFRSRYSAEQTRKE